jgi:hypothetical protein
MTDGRNNPRNVRSERERSGTIYPTDETDSALRSEIDARGDSPDGECPRAAEFKATKASQEATTMELAQRRGGVPRKPQIAPVNSVIPKASRSLG